MDSLVSFDKLELFSSKSLYTRIESTNYCYCYDQNFYYKRKKKKKKVKLKE